MVSGFITKKEKKGKKEEKQKEGNTIEK